MPWEQRTDVSEGDTPENGLTFSLIPLGLEKNISVLRFYRSY